MDEIAAWVEGLRQAWRALLPGTFERTFVTAACFALFYFLLVWAIERACGTRTGHYRTRGFAHDLTYYMYSKGGLQRYVMPVAFVASLHEPLSFLSVKLLDDAPYPLRVIGWILIADFLNYWLHRAKHAWRPLWAFHTTHHSAEHVNFATFSRVHPVEDLMGQLLGLAMLLLAGAGPFTSLAIYLLLDFVNETQHTQIPWRGGPLRWIFVTPAFHMYHHSKDAAHRDHNFGNLFSIWDRLFGTAVDERNSPPVTQYGLDEVKPTTFLGTLTTPFVLLWRYYGPQPAATRVRE